MPGATAPRDDKCFGSAPLTVTYAIRPADGQRIRVHNMLQKIREATSGWFAGVILSVIIITFALWGINGYFSGQVDTYAARITLKPGWFGTGIGAKYKDISVEEFRKQFDRERERKRAELKENFDVAKFDSVTNKRKVMDQMVQRELLLAASMRDGLAVSDQQLSNAILAIPSFQVEGKFDKSRYQEVLGIQNPPKSPKQFEAGVREDILAGTLPTELVSSEIVGDPEIDEFIRLKGQKRDVRYLDIPTPADTTRPADSDLQAWYQAHIVNYRTQEQIALEYLELDASTLQMPTSIDEATLRQRYDEQKNRFIEPEQRLASHILINVPANADAAAEKAVQAKAAALAAQARAPGADFAALARSSSQDEGSKNLGGDLGWLSEKVIAQKAFASALYALKPGQISDPVRSNEGWHIIQLRDVRPGRQIPFETVRAELEKNEIKDAREKLYSDRSGKLVDLTLKDSTSLAPAARELGMAILKTPLFSNTGGGGIAANPKVLAAAFSASVLQDGNTSDPIEIGDNHDHMVVIRVAQHLPVRTLPLAQARDRVLADVLADRRAKTARIAADALLARAAKGESLDAFAGTGNILVVPAVARDAAMLPQTVIDTAFRLPRPVSGKPLQKDLAQLAPDHYALVEVVQVVDGDSRTLDPAARASLRQQFGQARAYAETRAFIDALKREFPVKVAEDRL